jgi:hypothetical protein
MTVNDGPLVACNAMLPTRSHEGSASASAAERAWTFWMSCSALMPTWPTAPNQRCEYTARTRTRTRTTAHAHAPPHTHTHAPLPTGHEVPAPATCTVGFRRMNTLTVRWCSSTTAASGTSAGSKEGNLLILFSGPRSRGTMRMTSWCAQKRSCWRPDQKRLRTPPPTKVCCSCGITHLPHFLIVFLFLLKDRMCVTSK